MFILRTEGPGGLSSRIGQRANVIGNNLDTSATLGTQGADNLNGGQLAQAFVARKTAETQASELKAEIDSNVKVAQTFTT